MHLKRINVISCIMKVIKRSGKSEDVDFNKITRRITALKNSTIVDPIRIAQKVCTSIYDGICTSQLDEVSADIAISLSTEHPDYGTLASHISVSNIHKKTSGNFMKNIELLYDHGILSEDVYHVAKKNTKLIKSTIQYKNDYEFDYFALKTMEKSYLFKVDNQLVERPQDMLMRVSLGIHGDAIDDVIETYILMSRKFFIHATPTLFNAGTKRPQMSSCFLLELKDDSIQGIYDTLKDCAMISKWAGGIGLHIHKMRATGADIRTNKGVCSGIVPALKMFNATSRYVNQGGKRPGSIAIYLSVEHPDIMKLLELKKNHGDEEERCRDLFYGLWVSDLFMKRVEQNGIWSLFCPSKVPDLSNVYGEEYERIYVECENKGLYNTQINAQSLWTLICTSQIETGTPYLVYKDAVNRKTNQQNVGVIKTSNLCVAPETMILTDKGEQAISTLENKYVNVWNGKQFSNVQIRKTSENEKLIEIEFNNNRILHCTENHKFYVNIENKYVVEKRAFELQGHETLIETKYPDGKRFTPLIRRINKNLNRSDETFCFSEPKEHKGVFNGILTGQCTEIMEYTSPEEVAVCNLASISLPAFVTEKKFDFDQLIKITKIIVNNLNTIIDKNFYPIPEAEYSNKRHRPLGIGVQGLADVYMMLDMPFDSVEACQLNKQIFETIYYAAMWKSMELSTRDGPYDTFHGSPVSKGVFQFDMWGCSSDLMYAKSVFVRPKSAVHSWDELKSLVVEHGVRNSLMVAPMPTATTSQILGNNECIEPYTSNIYIRRTLAGEFVIVNKHLIKKLIDLKMWSTDVKNNIIKHEGSVQQLEIPKEVKDLFKTAWELKQKVLIDHAADRGVFVCQSQSLNLFIPRPTISILSSMHFYSWNKGLKTGIYYLRTKPTSSAIQITCESCSA
jgi:ribonucleotide reductase alpha subunit